MTATTKVGRTAAVVLVSALALVLPACGQQKEADERQGRAVANDEAKHEARRGGVLHSSSQLGNSAVHTFTAPFFDKELGGVVYRHCVLVEGQKNDQLDCSDPM